MHGAQEFLTALTLVLGVAAVTTVVFQRLRQPVVLGYILAGLIIGPHVPTPVVANPEIVHTLSELGVIMLMFGLGLEFTIAKLVRAAPTAGTTGVLQASAMVWFGYVTGRALGWTSLESIFTGALIAISSTTIIAKAFDEQGIQGRLRELVVAILIVEDLIAVLLMAVLTAVATGSGLSAAALVVTVGRLVGFLLTLVAVGLLIVPRVMRAILRLGRAETTIVATIGVCFGCSLLAHAVGYSVALGAFVGGMLVAESGETPKIEPLVQPVRDIFAAVFFVSVGMMIDPATLVEHWVAIVVLVLVVIVGKLVTVTFGAFMTGMGTRTSISAGMSLAQIGEFSFIIAGLGLTLGVVGNHLYVVAVAVSAITTLTTPWLIRAAGPFGELVDRKLPKPLQTFVTFYESWIDRIRSSRRERRSELRRLIRVLVIDTTVVIVIVIGVSLGMGDLSGVVRAHLDVAPATARLVVVAAGGTVALPFCLGILSTTRRFARALAETVVPLPAAGGIDLGRAPRRVIVASVQLAGVLIVGVPLVALTQPFLPSYTAAAVLGVATLVLAILFWRTAINLEGHVRAVTNVIIEALATQTASPAESHDLLPGIEAPDRIVVEAGSPAAGRSLAELALRASTGATVLAIVRDGQGIPSPDAHEPLRVGDVLALTGTDDAIAAAAALFARPTTS